MIHLYLVLIALNVLAIWHVRTFMRFEMRRKLHIRRALTNLNRVQVSLNNMDQDIMEWLRQLENQHKGVECEQEAVNWKQEGF